MPLFFLLKYTFRKNLQGANGNPTTYRGKTLTWTRGRRRYYDPEVGRFLNEDLVSYLEPETIGGINLYAYCGNAPVNNIDLGGTMPNWLK